VAAKQEEARSPNYLSLFSTRTGEHSAMAWTGFIDLHGESIKTSAALAESSWISSADADDLGCNADIAPHPPQFSLAARAPIRQLALYRIQLDRGVTARAYG